MPAAARRFYRNVSTVARDGGYAVLLDDRPVQTPGRAGLLIPTQGLAEAIAEEWRAQGEQIETAKLPLTRLANTAVDRVAPASEQVVDELVRYGGSDLLCYRAAEPSALAARQDTEWQPLLDWLAERHGLRLTVTREVNPVAQDPRDLAALAVIIAKYDPFALTGLAEAVGVLGSLVLGLALLEGRLDGLQAFALSQLDERFQVEQWGEDWEAARRAERLREDLLTAERFVRLAAA